MSDWKKKICAWVFFLTFAQKRANPRCFRMMLVIFPVLKHPKPWVLFGSCLFWIRFLISKSKKLRSRRQRYGLFKDDAKTSFFDPWETNHWWTDYIDQNAKHRYERFELFQLCSLQEGSVRLLRIRNPHGVGAGVPTSVVVDLCMGLPHVAGFIIDFQRISHAKPSKNTIFGGKWWKPSLFSVLSKEV